MRRRFRCFEEGMLIGCVRQKGICELWRAVALYRGTLQEPYASEDRLRLSLHEEMSFDVVGKVRSFSGYHGSLGRYQWR